MTNYLTLPVGPKSPELVNAVIEIPLEGISKYEYDKELHVFRLDRNLFSPVHYPGDYGFIPSTLGDDGDPLDVLVLVDTPSFPGCVQEVRPIGALEMTHFFSIYKDLEGKSVEVKGWRDAEFARTLVLKAQQQYIDNKITPVVHAPKI